MTEQPTFADLEYQHKKRLTRREVFLKRIDSLIPWERLEERIRPHYFKAERGRRPYPLSAMLRVHIVQLCYNVSDPGMEDPPFSRGQALLYEAESVRRFAGLRLSEPLYKYSSLQHHLNVCYKDCAKMHCLMFDMAFCAGLYSRCISKWPSVDPCNADALSQSGLCGVSGFAAQKSSGIDNRGE